MKLEPRKYIIVVILVWTVTILGSLYWNIFQQKKSSQNEYIKTAKAFVQQILITRSWNASHGGVYLRVSDSLQPNPYLQVTGRDIETSDGTQLTLINPAFMTRMISEIAIQQGQVQFHLTSLKPINPGNAPSSWERAALTGFEDDAQEEYYYSHQIESTKLFSFMVPLITDKSCLKCHQKQGYQVGDIRGGVSVTFPIHTKKTNALIISHLLLLSAGILLIAGFGERIVRLTERLKKQSHIDGLTEIANRKYFDENLHREWLRSRRMKTPLSLIMFDLDHFKSYNDTYGHQAGDRCLKEIAQALSHSVNRPADMVARYGGEEFVVILPDTPSEGAITIAEIMQTVIEKLHIEHNASLTADYVTISQGVATMTSQLLTEKDLIEAADKALYASKGNGRNIFTHANDL